MTTLCKSRQYPSSQELGIWLQMIRSRSRCFLYGFVPQSSAGILEQFMGARKRVGIGLSYQLASLCSLAGRYDKPMEPSVRTTNMATDDPWIFYSKTMYRLVPFSVFPSWVVRTSVQCWNFRSSMRGLGSEQEQSCHTGPPGYLCWWNRFLGICIFQGSLKVLKYHLSCVWVNIVRTTVNTKTAQDYPFTSFSIKKVEIMKK